MSPITSEGFGKMLVAAGVITQERADRISRIVIDVTCGRPVMVYVQEYGDNDALGKLAPMLEGMIPDGGQ